MAADGGTAPLDAGRAPVIVYRDVTETHLPTTLGGFSMDARFADLDRDGDLDGVIATEFQRNRLLLNDGQGHFTDASDRLPEARRDSEDVVIADFDDDGDLDLFFASEDDRVNELYLAEGDRFIDASDRIPVLGVSNAAILDPGAPEPTVLIGNAGQNTAIAWRGDRFVDVTAERLPSLDDRTQDLELADVDGDGDLDLGVGNEDASYVLLREGDRFGRPVSLPSNAETREIDFLDADGDGDLDLALANIRFLRPEVTRSNQLLLQTQSLTFEAAPTFPSDDDNSFDIEPVDLDGDGDLDLVSANLDALSGTPANAPYRCLLNDGGGRFEISTLLPPTAVGNGFDVEPVDVDGDGDLDLYLASRGGADRLLLRE